MTAVIVQCRLSSTRLPGKALLPLGGKPLLAWTLGAMKKVEADFHLVATEALSLNALKPAALEAGWDIIAGPLEDVLERFCVAVDYLEEKARIPAAAKRSKAPKKTISPEAGGGSRDFAVSYILRATGDNPFLFFEAAQKSLEAAQRSGADYFTYTGLPHGSGVEVIKTSALLDVRKTADSAFEREHVGPALYRHPEKYRCEFVPYLPEKSGGLGSYRTTVDTEADYRRAQKITAFLGAENAPYTEAEIAAACEEPAIARPVLLVPATLQGRGTGHLRRCLNAAAAIGADVLIKPGETVPEALVPRRYTNDTSACITTNTVFPLQGDAGSSFFLPPSDERKPEKLGPFIVPSVIPGYYALIIADVFRLSFDEASALRTVSPLAALDEGTVGHRQDISDCCDYLLDIIPGIRWHTKNHRVNDTRADLLDLPKNRRPKAEKASAPRNVLVSLGGEDPAGLTQKAADAARKAGFHVHVIDGAKGENLPNLKEHLAEYDAVITHYGLTAWEARSAGCAVLLLGTTKLHLKLAEKFGFPRISRITPGAIAKALVSGSPAKRGEMRSGAAEERKDNATGGDTIGGVISGLAAGTRFDCPLCRRTSAASAVPDPVSARTPTRTFRVCAACGLEYLAWTNEEGPSSYGTDYFFDDYKAQYGKTYLEDFAHIKALGIGRAERIRRIAGGSGALLDVGCAYGPFLAAAAARGFTVTGTDINADAVSYVKNTLGFDAFTGDFSQGPRVGGTFDALTMWFVIEHFADLGSALEAVRAALKPGGIFAFSTPNAAGISARRNSEAFHTASPRDHLSLWSVTTAAAVLARQGFAVQKIVSTGHHSERFPPLVPRPLAAAASRLFALGDTFEVYAKRL